MQHTLVAVFDNRTDAQNAMNELLSSNFSRQDVRLSNADPTGMTDSVTGASEPYTNDGTGDSIGASIKHFFTDLFGADNSEHASRYEGAVTRGHHVLTLIAVSLPEVERAADIIERYGPTDIDETASGERTMRSEGDSVMGAPGGMAGVPESMRMSGAGGMQQSMGASAQSAQSNSVLAQQLDDAGDRKLFAQQSLNQAEPMGQTYQEPMGKSGLSATGGTSFQGSTLQENSVQGSSLDGTQGGAIRGSALEGSAYQAPSAGSQQRDTSSGMGGMGSSGSMRAVEIQRGRSRIYSPAPSKGPSLDIGSLPGDDDEYYRNHFLANYRDSGDDYDSYKPAYSYGSDMARDSRYSGRKWDEVEPELQSDWASRSGYAAGATWEKMKLAVRRGWDRITGDDDDTHYRSHYDANLKDSGDDYDSYKPAYSYGSEMRKSQLYRNQPWDDIEGDMRRGWDSRITAGTGSTSTGTTAGATVGGAWDRMKSAVRHGWDSVTGDDEDDRAYRNHWNATYSTSSDAGSYDEYKPAYSYGSEMARDEKYRGRQWTEVESDLRSDWDSRYGSSGVSTWERMKSAVRQGWDRMTS